MIENQIIGIFRPIFQNMEKNYLMCMGDAFVRQVLPTLLEKK